MDEKELDERELDEKELQEWKLEEIIREFRQDPEELSQEDLTEMEEELSEFFPAASDAQERQTEAEASAEHISEVQTVLTVEETLETEHAEEPVTGDTIRLDGLAGKLPKGQARQAEQILDDSTRRLELPEQKEPFSEEWEPEYEQPMGEYVAPQPIVFRPRSRLRDLKRDLVAGPEKRYYELSEKGLGKLQAAIFFSLLVALISTVATVLYAAGMVQPERLKLMVFGQFFAMLISGLLGIYQMIEGITDVLHKRFTLNTLLVVTFLACCADGVFGLKQQRVPCCAAFCLQVSMSLLQSFERRKTEMGLMDTMRKANRLDGVAVCPDYYEGKKGLLRKEGQVADFMSANAEPSEQEKKLNRYALAALLSSVAVAVVSGVLHGVAAGVQALAVTLLAAMPATAFITISRPFAVLERRFHGLGTVLCGWKGAEGLCGEAVFPLDSQDLYPVGSARLNGVKFYGSRQPDQVVSYCTAVVAADGGGLAPVFTQMLDSRNGYHYTAENFRRYEDGIGAEVDGTPVLVGPLEFLKKMGADVPEGIRVNNAVCVSIDGEFSGLFAVSYDKVRASLAGILTLTGSKKLDSVVTSSDFILNSRFLQSRFGAKAARVQVPDYAVRQQLEGKELPEDAPCLLMTTKSGLASMAYGVTGARALISAGKMGVLIHMIGGILGIGMMLALVLLGAMDLLTPVNMLIYQLIWMLPGFLITEWTRTI